MQSAAQTEYPVLPQLKPGIQLVTCEDALQGVLQALAVDHLLQDRRTAAWVDDGRHARPDLLTRVAPSTAVLERVQVARGFTAFQHRALVDRVGEAVGTTADLVVVPVIDRHYRDDDLRGDEGTEMLVDALATLAGLARRQAIPVLVTLAHDDGVADPVRAAADRTIRCRQTPMGPRFVGEDVETLVYPEGDGTVQTTLAFWAEVLQERQALHGAQTPGIEAGDAGVTNRGPY